MKLLNTNRFYLKGTGNRFLHLATIQEGMREFMCFRDQSTNRVYIEEVSGGSLLFVDDDALAFAIAKFLEDRGVTDIAKPALPDDVWLRIKPHRPAP